MNSHWVTMTTNRSDQNITISSASANTLFDDLRLSVRAIERAKEELGVSEYDAAVRTRAQELAKAGVPRNADGTYHAIVHPSVAIWDETHVWRPEPGAKGFIGRPAWLRD